MPVACQPSSPVIYHSRYTSCLLVDFIRELSLHTPSHIKYKSGPIRMKHDSYSRGTILDLFIAMPDANGSTYQYVAVIKRHRKRPDPLPTVVELYSMLSLAAKFRKQKSHTDVVKVRLFIVHSCWVQVLSATAPLSYILSIHEGRDQIEGSLEINESPWFNILTSPGLERLLLFAFEFTTLNEQKRIPDIFLRYSKKNIQPQSPKHEMDHLEGKDVKRQKVL